MLMMLIFCLMRTNFSLISFFKPFSIIKNNELNFSYLNMKKDTLDTKSLSLFYKPKGDNQKKYVKYLNEDKTKILFAVGPAGTGKTMLACNAAIRELKCGNINKIVLTRPVVPVEEDIGFLPGNINKKMDPWTRPIFDVFLEFFSQKDIDLMLQNNIIEISPLAYMRGRTFKKSFIIADEMQNSSPNQMLMLTTRIGEGSKMVITGDLNQSDKGQNSGLSDFIKKYKLYETQFIKKQNDVELYNKTYNSTDFNIGVKIVELNNTDIERSPIVVKILEIYSVNENRIQNIQNIQKNNSIVTNKTVTAKTDNYVSKNISRSIGPSPELFMSSAYYSDAALIPSYHTPNTSRARKLFWEK